MKLYSFPCHFLLICMQNRRTVPFLIPANQISSQNCGFLFPPESVREEPAENTDYTDWGKHQHTNIYFRWEKQYKSETKLYICYIFLNKGDQIPYAFFVTLFRPYKCFHHPNQHLCTNVLACVNLLLKTYCVLF